MKMINYLFNVEKFVIQFIKILLFGIDTFFIGAALEMDEFTRKRKA